MDKIIRGTALDGAVRFFTAVTTEMVRTAADTHKASALAAVTLGRTLTAAVLMSQDLKGEDNTLTIQIKGDGPLGGVVVVSDAKANARGYVYNPEVELPLNPWGKFDVAAGLGTGQLNVIKDLGLSKPYIGYVELLSGEIAEDLAFYYAFSEQTHSIVALGVLVAPDGNIKSSGGYIIQLMPDAPEEAVQFLEKRVSEIEPVTQLVDQGMSPEEIAKHIFEGKDIHLYSEMPCGYRCNCSRERMERNLISLGREELKSLADEEETAELQCHFCNTFYHFTKEELLKLLES